ncbi:GAF domain-containing protein [Lujinxingia vulgaris]|uniref:GAF domain-containing protein n=1 Tax=Lujinxingia vulgaris TaxID=2600176 RepID=A0A5C6XEN2_9DELT|nr:GAF domain-containing protein [Lujinxingia vulgaris]TXD35858.1 GAF domain-containing protein [Lujinxingia vulgaris]
MTSSPPPAQLEDERLAALRRFAILDTPPDGAFDRIVQLAARVFDAPIALVSLVDEDRVWFKARHGLDVEKVGRDPGLCASVVFSDDAYMIEDAIEDPRSLAHPLVAGEFGLRFYAAAPLLTRQGHRLGALAVMGFEPREFGEGDRETLHDLAALVMEQMELRLTTRELLGSLERFITNLHDMQDPERYITLCAWTKSIRVGDDWMTFEHFLRSKLGLTVTHGIHPDAAEKFRSQAGSDEG